MAFTLKEFANLIFRAVEEITHAKDYY